MLRLPVSLALGLLSLALLVPLAAQDSGGGEQTGDAAVVERYTSWALKAMQEGRLAEAEAALERSGDFSDLSSDVSYLLALVRFRSGRPIGAVLESLARARAVDRWVRYGRDASALLEAQALIAVRDFGAALNALSGIRAGNERTYLRLRALVGSGSGYDFRRELRTALDAYPQDTRLPRLFFDYSQGRLPDAVDRDILDVLLKRLPVLIEIDPDLSYAAAPFMKDAEEARRVVAAYRAGGGNKPEALPILISLGLVSDLTAAEELFALKVLDLKTIRSLWALLRDDSARTAFARLAADFTGIIEEDADRDGRPEGRTSYVQGRLAAAGFDLDQDNLPELEMSFLGDLPVQGTSSVMDDLPRTTTAAGADAPGAFARPVSSLERLSGRIQWDRYPYVSQVEIGTTRFFPIPRAFAFAPVRLVPLLVGNASPSVLYPQLDSLIPKLTERSLVSFSSALERPGTLAPGSVERLQLLKGVLFRSAETVQGRTIAVLEFHQGMPVLQRLDLDMDGRMETLKRFRPRQGIALDQDPLGYELVLESLESDWDGDGRAEYAETHYADGVRRFWDTDGDGKREQSQWFPKEH